MYSLRRRTWCISVRWFGFARTIASEISDRKVTAETWQCTLENLPTARGVVFIYKHAALLQAHGSKSAHGFSNWDSLLNDSILYYLKTKLRYQQQIYCDFASCTKTFPSKQTLVPNNICIASSPKRFYPTVVRCKPKISHENVTLLTHDGSPRVPMIRNWSEQGMSYEFLPSLFSTFNSVDEKSSFWRHLVDKVCDATFTMRIICTCLHETQRSSFLQESQSTVPFILFCRMRRYPKPAVSATIEAVNMLIAGRETYR